MQLLRQRRKVLISKTADEKPTGHNIVDIAVHVPQGAVQGLALQLGFLTAYQRHGVVIWVDRLDIAVHSLLQGGKVGADALHARVLSRLHHEHLEGVVRRSFGGDFLAVIALKLHLHEIVRIQNMIPGVPLVAYHLLCFLFGRSLHGHGELQRFGDGHVKFLHARRLPRQFQPEERERAAPPLP